MRARKKHRFRMAVVSTLAAVLAIGLSTSAWGYWSAQSPALTASITTLSVPAIPEPIGCINSGSVGTGRANLSWTALPKEGSDPWLYQVWLRTADGKTGRIDNGVSTDSRGQTASTLSISSGLLTSLLGSLIGNILDLLTAPDPPRVYVVPVHKSGWIGPATASVPIRSVILIGVQCG